jgi:hypothetical protein
METWKLAGLAVVIEAVLVVAAAFGGPHGTLGGWPWALQLPGILVVLYPPGGEHFVLRVGVMALVQVTIWYVLLRAARRAWRVRAS